METAVSVNGIPIRLTYERWYHITESHDDLSSYFHDVLETVEKPDIIVRGNGECCKAAKNFGKKKWLVVVFREISKRDGTVNFVTNCLVMANDVLRLPAQKTWIDYDKEADVLYMSFRKPQRATNTIEMDEDVLLRKDGDEIVGITIMNASARKKNRGS